MTSETGNGKHAERRENYILRDALRKITMQKYDEIGNAELHLLKATYARLATLEDPAPVQARLAALLKEGLPHFEVRQAPLAPGGAVQAGANSKEAISANEIGVETVEDAEASSLTAVQQAGGEHSPEGIDVASVLADAAPQEVHDFGGLHLHLRAKVFEANGDVFISGDVPDNVAIFCPNGKVRVAGFVFGHVYAYGGIDIRHNVQGGWLYSRTGDIRALRILAASKIVAPSGNVKADAVEKCELLFSGKSVLIKERLFGGRLFARRIEADSIVGARLVVLDQVDARQIDVEGKQASIIHFAPLLTSQAYHQELTDQFLLKMIGVARKRFRAIVWRVFSDAAWRDKAYLCHMLLLILHAQKAPAINLQEVRNAHEILLYGPAIVAGGRAMLRLTKEGDALGSDYLLPVVGAGLEEVQEFIKVAGRGVDGIRHDLSLDCKDLLGNELRQLNNLSKKIRDGVTAKRDIASHETALEKRIELWQEEVKKAKATLATLMPAVQEALGDALYQEMDSQVLSEKVRDALEQASDSLSKKSERHIQILDDALGEHAAAAGKWRQIAVKAEKELELAYFDKEGSATFMRDVHAPNPSISADIIGRDTLLTTAPYVPGHEPEPSRATLQIKERIEESCSFEVQENSIKCIKTKPR